MKTIKKFEEVKKNRFTKERVTYLSAIFLPVNLLKDELEAPSLCTRT